ncbi:rnhA, partial [Mucuna pruriens]
MSSSDRHEKPPERKGSSTIDGRVTALSRFISKASETATPILNTLKKEKNFAWTPECEEAFLRLKAMLATPPILVRPELGQPLYLYMSVTDAAISSVLIQKKGKEHIIVRTDLPVRQVLRKPDLARRMVAWSVQLSEFDISFEKRGHVRAQGLADFITELTPEYEQTEGHWYLSVDGSSNQIGSEAGVILEGPDGILIEQSLHFDFKASNNQAEYEALFAGMRLALEIEARWLTVKSDSKLMTGQVNGEYQTKDPKLAKYWEKATTMAASFESFMLLHVPRDQNERADLLAKLSSTKRRGLQRSTIYESLNTPTIDRLEVQHNEEKGTWMDPIIEYLKSEKLPEDPTGSFRMKKGASKYTLVKQRLYRRGFSYPLLRCIDGDEVLYIIQEVHEGICGTHIGG